MVVPQEAHGDPGITPGPITEAPVAAKAVAAPPEVTQTVAAQTVATPTMAAQTAQTAQAAPTTAVPVGDVIATAPLPHTAQPTHLTPVDALPHRPAGAKPGTAAQGRKSLLPPRWDGTTARCSLHWSGWLALVPFAVVSLVTATASARARGMGPMSAAGYVLAATVWGLTAALAVAWVAWRLRGRTRAVATAAFVAALGFISIAGASGTVARGAAQTTVVKALRAKAWGEATQAAHRADASIDHAFDCLQADGGLSLRGVSDIAQIDRRLGLFDDVLRAVREGREQREAVQTRLEVDLAAAHILPAERARALAAFRAEVQWDADRKIIEATEAVLTAGRDELRFLRQEWGRMKVNRETGVCTFQDKRSAQQLRQLSARVGAANAALRAAVKEGVARVQSGADAKPHELSAAPVGN